MAIASNNEYPSVLFTQQSDSPTGAVNAGNWRLFFKSDGLYSVNSSSNIIGPYGTSGSSGGIGADGWDGGVALTYVSSDSPTYSVSCTGDKTTSYYPGMRIKLTDVSTKYFIITSASYSTSTVLTLYGGTDYVLSGSPITNPYYSSAKAPAGFPLDPTKWTLETSGSTSAVQTNPSQSTWYNLGSLSINIPLGLWKIEYHVCAYAYDGTSGAVNIKSTLSTANNSESDASMSARLYVESGTTIIGTHYKSKFLTLASKATYYLNANTSHASQDEIGHRGDYTSTIIRAISSYL